MSCCVYSAATFVLKAKANIHVHHIDITKMPYRRMTPGERYEAIGMLRAGMPLADIAIHFLVCKKTINRLAHRYNLTGEVVDRPRSGRPRKTTAAEDRMIRTIHLRQRTRTACQTAREWVGHNDITRHIVRRRLKSFGIRCRRPVKKFGLTGWHRARRLNGAITYRRWTLRQWSDLIFSDESVFLVEKIGNNVRVYRRVNERYADANIPTAGERRSVMVWGAISTEGKSELIRFRGNVDARRYQDEALEPALLPFKNAHQRRMKLMQDGATPHTARTTREWLYQHNIELFGPWPSKSPDMNPIENAWGLIERKIRERLHQPQNEDELYAALRDEWANLGDDYLRRLVLSMRRRVTALFTAAGGHTRY